ncbi:hypothetical protein ACJ41O_015230 [Fusarium nematophilum]
MSLSRVHLRRASDKLLAERYRLDAWARRVGEIGDAPTEVIVIYKKLEEQLQDVSKQIQQAETSTVVGFAIRSFTAGLGDPLGTRALFEDELRTCGQLNDALEAYASNMTNDRLERLDKELASLGGLTKLGSSIGSIKPSPPSDITKVSPPARATTIDRGTMTEEVEVKRRPECPHLSLEAAYSISVQGLNILSRGLACKDFQELSSRLEIWGVGLFRGPLHLDHVFEHGHAQNPHINLQYMVAHLGFEEAIVLSFFDDAEALLNSLERPDLLENASIGILLSADEAYENQIFRCVTRIYEEIENLYELLPAIGTIRNTCCSLSEQEQKDPERQSQEDSSWLGNVFEEPVDQSLLAKETLQLAQSLTLFLRLQGKEGLRSKAEGPTDDIVPRLRKDVKRLEQWKESSAKRPMNQDIARLLLEMGRSMRRLLDELSPDTRERIDSGRGKEKRQAAGKVKIHEILDDIGRRIDRLQGG